ncbi:hypothetical protein HPB48_012475 [Haemaphysalis longicornis]|uniref:Endonuclease/exonuclease/phosphatase domain-containing protein n=1 Tax=Haemaphysalis longicornis TaxID=44386 RepID=A0A9J6GH41_HAELO|nr:hypothetical protein HPB48_012475 [Haemaphysalis longicornis]
MSLEGLKFMQANLDHTRAATSTLIDFPQNQAVHFTIVGDPYVRSGSLPGLPHTISQFAHPTDPKVLLLTQSIPFDPFPVLLSQYVVAIKFSSRSFSFLLVAIYAAPSIPVAEVIGPCNQLLLRDISPFVIIAGDFNAKSPRWGGLTADGRGDQLVQFLMAHDLDLLNDPASIPTFSTDYSDAWIDITIFSSAWRNFATAWKVCDTPTLSDHRYILFSVRSSRLPSCRRLTRAGRSRVSASLAATRWFRQVSNCHLDDPQSLDFVVDHFYDTLENARAANMATVRVYPQAKPWWSDEIARQRSWVRGLRRRYQCTSDLAERLTLATFIIRPYKDINVP